MNKDFKKAILPEFRKKNFKGSWPHLRRINENTIDLITFQSDRYGSSAFVIELAQAPAERFTTYWGKKIDPHKLTAHDLSKRIRIHTKGILKSSSLDDWFKYKNTKETATDVLSKLELIEKVFSNFEEYLEKD